jgi:DNA-binding response OmpR family regulator
MAGRKTMAGLFLEWLEPREQTVRSQLSMNAASYGLSALVIESGPSADLGLVNYLQSRVDSVVCVAPDRVHVEPRDPWAVVVLVDRDGELNRQLLPPDLLWECPCLVVAGDEVSRSYVLAWLEWGADAVLHWPAGSAECACRMQNASRSRRFRDAEVGRALRVGELSVWPELREAFLGRVRLRLTDYEFRILEVLAAQPGQPITRERILELAKGSAEEAFERSIDVRVSRLRRKLERNPRRPVLLKTVRGMGYMLAASDHVAERWKG